MANTRFAARCQCETQNVEGQILYRIQQNRSSIITNDIDNALVHPSSDSIAVMKTSDGRRDQSFAGESLCGRETNLGQPLDVELDFLPSVRVCRIVQSFVGESVRYVGKVITVCWVLKPGGQAIGSGALPAPRVVPGSGRPDIRSGAKGFLELQCGIDLVRIFDPCIRIAITVIINGSLDITVSVVANFYKVRRARRKP